jgi:glucosamine--fructose-6-phosphate aminotransferase (isomerizing)
MFNDIIEQPKIINTLAKKYLPIDQPVQEIDLSISIDDIKSLSKIYIVASGSSRNVGNIAKYFFENVTNIPVFVDYASEFAHRNPVLNKNDLFIAISQSGETGDTIAALKVAIDKGAHTFAITNNPDSKIYHMAKSKMQVDAGKEISIPATKSFTAQLFNLYVLALCLAEKRKTLNPEKIKELKQEFRSLGDKIENFLQNPEEIYAIAEKLKDFKSIALVGRGPNSAVAEEGALKIKETTYINANGYPTGEFLHGYIAVVDENIPVISIIDYKARNNNSYNLSVTNTEKIKATRDPYLIIIKNQEDNSFNTIPSLSDADFINIPQSENETFSILSVISLQLLAFKMAEHLGRDVNNPRSLTKSIVSE